MKLNWAERLVVNSPVRVMVQRRIIKWIKGVTRIAPQARILEVGCGLGLVGARLQGLGARVWAVEPDPEQAAYARDHHGLTVFCGRFEEAALEAAPFDLILASHVIEHFPEPLAFLGRGSLASAGHQRVTKVSISSLQNVPLQVDGDFCGYLPAEIEIIPGAIRMFTPTPMP